MVRVLEFLLEFLKACLVVALAAMLLCMSRPICGLLVLLSLTWIWSRLFIKKRPYSKNAALRTRRLDDGYRQLLRPLVVKVTVRNNTRIINIPAGFRTDYSSIPTLLQWFVRWSKVDVAGVVHDWLYRTGILERKEADIIWRDIAMSGNKHASHFQAQVCYFIGLRIAALPTWYCYRIKYRQVTKQSGRGKRWGKIWFTA